MKPIYLLLVLMLVGLISSFDIKSESEQTTLKIPTVNSPPAEMGNSELMTPKVSDPVSIYGDHIKNQTVLINYGSFVDASTKQICFLLFTSLGDAPGGEFWVNLQAEYFGYWSRGYGRGQSVWIQNSEHFCFAPGPSRLMTLRVTGKISGANNGISLYVTQTYV